MKLTNAGIISTFVLLILTLLLFNFKYSKEDKKENNFKLIETFSTGPVLVSVIQYSNKLFIVNYQGGIIELK